MSTVSFHWEYNPVYFFKTWLTYQLKIGPFWMPNHSECPGLWHIKQSGVQPLKLDYFPHNVKLSFFLKQMSQPAVNFLIISLPLTITFWSPSLRAEAFFYDQQKLAPIDMILGIHQLCNDVAAICVISPSKNVTSRRCMLKWSSDWMYQIVSLFPLLGVVSLNLNISPPTLGFSLDLHPKQRILLHFAIHPHLDDTAVYYLCPDLLNHPM